MSDLPFWHNVVFSSRIGLKMTDSVAPSENLMIDLYWDNGVTAMLTEYTWAGVIDFLSHMQEEDNFTGLAGISIRKMDSDGAVFVRTTPASSARPAPVQSDNWPTTPTDRIVDYWGS